jgi:hypothetical protein
VHLSFFALFADVFCSLCFLRVSSCSQWHPANDQHSTFEALNKGDNSRIRERKMDAQDFSDFDSILMLSTVFDNNNFRRFYNDEKNGGTFFEDEDKALTGFPSPSVKYELSPASRSFELDLMPMTSSPISIRPQSTGSSSSSCDSEPQVRINIGKSKSSA